MDLPLKYTYETNWSLGPETMRVECPDGHATARTISRQLDPCDHVVNDIPCGKEVTVIMVGPYHYSKE